MTLLRGRGDQFQKHLGVAGLDEVVVEAAEVREDFIGVLRVLTAYSDQQGALAVSKFADLLGSIPSASTRHRYVHDDYVGIEIENVRKDCLRAVDALGVVPLDVKQKQQGIHHALIVVNNENTSALPHHPPSSLSSGVLPVRVLPSPLTVAPYVDQCQRNAAAIHRVRAS
jgi:hypothetical protein